MGCKYPADMDTKFRIGIVGFSHQVPFNVVRYSSACRRVTFLFCQTGTDRLVGPVWVWIRSFRENNYFSCHVQPPFGGLVLGLSSYFYAASLTGKISSGDLPRALEIRETTSQEGRNISFRSIRLITEASTPHIFASCSWVRFCFVRMSLSMYVYLHYYIHMSI